MKEMLIGRRAAVNGSYPNSCSFTRQINAQRVKAQKLKAFGTIPSFERAPDSH